MLGRDAGISIDETVVFGILRVPFYYLLTDHDHHSAADLLDSDYFSIGTVIYV